MKLGLKPGAMPRAKAGDFDKALALVAGVADAKATKKYLAELQDGTLAHDAAREAAEAAIAEAKRREGEAQAAEAEAIRARQKLADESAAAMVALDQREASVTDRENLVTEAEKSQELRDKELARREDHLKQAGVRGF